MIKKLKKFPYRNIYQNNKECKYFYRINEENMQLDEYYGILKENQKIYNEIVEELEDNGEKDKL